MAFVKSPSSPADAVRPYLEGVAKHLADRIWEPNGPAWGTSLTELEDLFVSLRQILSDKLLHAALQRQASGEPTHQPTTLRDCPSCSGPTEPREPEPRIVKTKCGEAEWQEPHAY